MNCGDVLIRNIIRYFYYLADAGFRKHAAVLIRTLNTGRDNLPRIAPTYNNVTCIPRTGISWMWTSVYLRTSAPVLNIIHRPRSPSNSVTVSSYHSRTYIRSASGRVIQSDCYMHARNSWRSSEAADNTRRFIFQESSPVAGALISEISADGISLMFVDTLPPTSRIIAASFSNARWLAVSRRIWRLIKKIYKVDCF